MTAVPCGLTTQHDDHETTAGRCPGSPGVALSDAERDELASLIRLAGARRRHQQNEHITSLPGGATEDQLRTWRREHPYPGSEEDAVLDAVVLWYATRVAAVVAERDGLARWKAEALLVLSGLQELGRALDLPLGVRITGDAAAETATELRTEREQLRAERDRALAAYDRMNDQRVTTERELRARLDAITQAYEAALTSTDHEPSCDHWRGDGGCSCLPDRVRAALAAARSDL